MTSWKPMAAADRGTQPARVRDAVRVIRHGAIGAELPVVLERLRELWDGLCAEGLDRAFKKPEGCAPSVRDLQLVCWELVLTEKLLRELSEAR